MEEEIKTLQNQIRDLRAKTRQWILLALMFVSGAFYFYNKSMIEDLHHRLDEIEEKTFTLNPYKFCPGFETQMMELKSQSKKEPRIQTENSHVRLQKDKK